MIRPFARTWLLAGALACGTDFGPTPPPPLPPDGLTLSNVASNLTFPVFLTAPPGDPRLFIVEKGGLIRVVEGGALLGPAFIDISLQVSTGSEQGLLGLAFHPEYATNGLFVVNYTDRLGATQMSQFRVSAADRNRADAASEQVFLTVAQPFANHNGGMVAFGPHDGRLYVGLGDGGSAGDPQGNGQNRGTLLGKILRFAVGSGGQVSVPQDNPFVGQAGRRPEIWSYGLRNPWRFSFDRATGDLYIGDVGQNQREEIDAVTDVTTFGRGLNFGWNVMEGRRCFSPASNCDQTGLTLPVLEYDHGDGCSVTGGYVYRGTAIPALQGTYFYGDFCRGWVRSFRLLGPTALEQREWPELAPGGSITSFGEDASGELYVLTSNGRVAKIVRRT